MHPNLRLARLIPTRRDVFPGQAALSIFASAPQSRIDKYDLSKASYAPRPKFPLSHRRAKALQSPSRIPRNRDRRRRILQETECRAIQAHRASAITRPENAAPRPTPLHAARSRLQRTRAHSSSFELVLQSVRSALVLIAPYSQTTGTGACRDVMRTLHCILTN